MPKTDVVIYQEGPEKVPLLEWLDGLSAKVQDKCTTKIELLQENGYGLRRPHCDLLKQGIRELRVRYGNVHYRVLYAFVDKSAVLISHGCTKVKKVPQREIDRALRNLKQYKQNPKAHTYSGEF